MSSIKELPNHNDLSCFCCSKAADEVELLCCGGCKKIYYCQETTTTATTPTPTVVEQHLKLSHDAGTWFGINRSLFNIALKAILDTGDLSHFLCLVANHKPDVANKAACILIQTGRKVTREFMLEHWAHSDLNLPKTLEIEDKIIAEHGGRCYMLFAVITSEGSDNAIVRAQVVRAGGEDWKADPVPKAEIDRDWQGGDKNGPKWVENLKRIVNNGKFWEDGFIKEWKEGMGAPEQNKL